MMPTHTSAFSILYSVQITLNNRYWDTSDECRRTCARVWNPTEIRDANVLRKVLPQMQSAERGLRRLEAALNRVGPETLVPILRSLRLNSFAPLDNLETLKRVVHGGWRSG
jgi:hypothetical protein